jgi:SAM-dependent methyltransferase
MQSTEDRQPTCRFCSSPLTHTFVDLGKSPLCETFLAPEQLAEMEPFYPLHVYVCDRCFLVQVEEFVPPEEIFSTYPYFSSYSTSMLEHARNYADSMTARWRLGSENLVVELGSNDGYLLQFFQSRGVPVLGVEPAGNVAEEAIAKGIPTRVEFFGVDAARRMVEEGLRADLVAGMNVLAQIPDLNGFVAGIEVLLGPQGVCTIEFPHVLQLVEGNLYDTIYHEHFSYFSFLSARRIFAAHGLEMFDVEEVSTHGGSLRVYACRADADHEVHDRVRARVELERARGLEDVGFYEGFGAKVAASKREILRFLIDAREAGKKVVGYGAPGKGNTLLNYCGIRTDLIDYTVDRNPHKHGRYLPGTHIPIHAPERIAETRPDYIFVLPWNLKDEIVEQMAFVREWGARFVIPLPRLEIL